jgi:hypothetical protein
VAYVIEYSPEAEDHMRWLTMRQQRIVFDTVDRQLLHQPIPSLEFVERFERREALERLERSCLPVALSLMPI